MQLNSLGGRRASFGTPGAAHPAPRTNNYKPLKAGKSVLLDICEISPFEKWTHYRVVPVKFLLHVALVVLTTACIVEDSVRWVPYRFANQQNFCYFFAPDKCVDNLCGSSSLSYGIDNPSNCYTYAINETIDAVQKIVGNYYDIHHRSVANYYLPQLPDGSLKKILMTIERQPHSSSDRTARRTATYWITPDDLGPLDTRKETPASISEFFELLLSMRLDLELDDTFASDRHELCYMWSVQVIFNVRNKAELSVNQKARVLGFCTDRMTGREIAVDPLRFWLNVLVILFGGLLGLLILKEWFDSYRLLAYARVAVMDLDAMPSVRDTCGQAPPAPVLLRRDSSLPDQQLFWDEVTTGIKARFFNFWLLETLLASILSTTEAAYNLMYYKGPMTSSTHTLMAGLGSALFWINLVNYLHHSDRLYAIVLVIRRSIPRVGKLLVQVIPIFVGYALFGVMVFGYYYPSFGTFAYASASLFSIWNGDMLLSTIQDLNIFFLYFGFFYVLLFVFAFIYVILNIVLCIVQQTLVHVYTVEAKRRHTIHRVLRRGRRGSVSQRRRVSTRDSIIDDDKYGTSKRDGTGVGLEPWSSSSRLFIEVLDLVKEHDLEGDIFCASFTAPSAAPESPREEEGGNGTFEGPSSSHRRRQSE